MKDIGFLPTSNMLISFNSFWPTVGGDTCNIHWAK